MGGRILSRHDAMCVLAARDSAFLSGDERLSVVLDGWGMDETDAGYEALPQALKVELASADGPGSVWQRRYEPLLLDVLGHGYVGVTNRYLEERLSAMGFASTVEGEVEQRAQCPCCRYLSISESGGYDICRVCFWEDCGTRELDRHSAPNHCTLREGRTNFARLGAMSQAFVDKVLPDGPRRYRRGAAGDVWRSATPPRGRKPMN